MKRLCIVVAALFCCAGAGVVGQQKEVASQAADARTVFLGWVDMNEDDWLPLGYENKKEWLEVIEWQNLEFQRLCTRLLPGWQVVSAKSRSGDKPSNEDLYVKFSEVKFDGESYRLSLAIHVIDVQSGAELAAVPAVGYRAGRFSINNCLQGALKLVSSKVMQGVARAAAIKTTKK